MAFSDNLFKSKNKDSLSPKRRPEILNKNKPENSFEVPKKLWYDEEFQPIIVPGVTKIKTSQTPTCEPPHSGEHQHSDNSNCQSNIIQPTSEAIPDDSSKKNFNINEANACITNSIDSETSSLRTPSPYTLNVPVNIDKLTTNESHNETISAQTDVNETKNKFDIILYNSLIHKIEALCNFLNWDKLAKNDLINSAKANTHDCALLIDELFERYISPENQKKQNLLLSCIEKEPEKCFVKITLPQAEIIFEIKTTNLELFSLFNGANFVFYPLHETPFDVQYPAKENN